MPADQTNMLTATPAGRAVGAGWRRRSCGPARSVARRPPPASRRWVRPRKRHRAPTPARREPSLGPASSGWRGLAVAPTRRSGRVCRGPGGAADRRPSSRGATHVLRNHGTHLGAAAALAGCIDSFAAHPFKTPSPPRLVKDAVGLTLTRNLLDPRAAKVGGTRYDGYDRLYRLSDRFAVRSRLQRLGAAGRNGIPGWRRKGRC